MKQVLVRSIAAFAAVLCLGMPALVAAPAHAASSAAFLKGTWVGACTGFYVGGSCAGDEKIKITKVKGHAAKGTWQYRASADESWSSPSQATFVVRAVGDGTWEVYGSDDNGTYEGVYTPWTGHLELAYMKSGPNGATFFFDLTRK